jgi:protein O-GlcNAc transferase
VQALQDDFLQAWRWHQQQQWHLARPAYAKLLKRQPRHLDALVASGLLELQTGNASVAAQLLNSATSWYPSSVTAWFHLGLAQLHLQDGRSALSSFARTCELAPDHKPAWNNRGNLLLDQGLPLEALACFDRVCALAPNEAAGHNNRGNALRDLCRLEDALSAYSQALALDAHHLESLNNRANVYMQTSSVGLAMKDFERALALAPQFSVTHRNLAHALAQQKRFAQAMAHFETSLKLQPLDPLTHCFLADMQRECRQLQAAQQSYQRAQQLDPKLDFIDGLCAQIQAQRCDWNGLTDRISRIEKALQQGQRSCLPFVSMALIDDPAIHAQAAKLLTRSCTTERPSIPLAPGARKPGRIRLGYYSADFHNHATTWLMAQLFELHDRSQFELFAFSFGPHSKDAMRERVSRAFDHFIEVNHLSDIQVAQRSRELGIDIAVDLKGHCQDARPGILAQRCAPVQVNYLVYPGTIGGDFIDYIIADEIVLPRGAEKHYVEKVARLPNCYQANDATKTVSTQVFTRAELGLPAHGFVYCCFNNNHKIMPSVFGSWMRILQRAPGSVLWLLEDHPDVRLHLQQQAEAAGLDPQRLVFAPRMEMALHLSRHRAADLFLDTLPYNAHTTASDALWAGLPVLTMMGQSFPARVAASLLTAVGLPELITRSTQAYEDLAVQLASEPDQLAAFKARLASQGRSSSLFNTPQLCRDLESIYQAMHQRHLQGQAPAMLDLWPSSSDVAVSDVSASPA